MRFYDWCNQSLYKTVGTIKYIVASLYIRALRVMNRIGFSIHFVRGKNEAAQSIKREATKCASLFQNIVRKVLLASSADAKITQQRCGFASTTKLGKPYPTASVNVQDGRPSQHAHIVEDKRCQRRLPSFGKTMTGLNVLASSKSISA